MRVADRLRVLIDRTRTRPAASPPPRPPRVGTPAADIRGSPPGDAEAEITIDSGRLLLLFFLTSSCYGCRPLWEGFGSWRDEAVGGRVVLVTPSPSTEDARAVGELAPARVSVVMSSDAWHAYGVTSAPWFVKVAGGVVVEDRPAPATWNDLSALISDVV
jgi:hypothetical protein